MTDSPAPRWRLVNAHYLNVETLPVNGGMDSKELQFMKAMMANFAKVAPSAPPTTEVDELRARLATLEALIAQAKPGEPATTTPSRRV